MLGLKFLARMYSCLLLQAQQRVEVVRPLQFPSGCVVSNGVSTLPTLPTFFDACMHDPVSSIKSEGRKPSYGISFLLSLSFSSFSKCIFCYCPRCSDLTIHGVATSSPSGEVEAQFSLDPPHKVVQCWLWRASMYKDVKLCRNRKNPALKRQMPHLILSSLIISYLDRSLWQTDKFLSISY